MQRTLVRGALALLLARPQLALEVEVPPGLAWVDKPGADVLRDLLERIRQSPGIAPVDLIEAYAGTPTHAALLKLSLIDLAGDEDGWRDDLATALERLAQEARSQSDHRRDELSTKWRSGGLSDAEKQELQQLIRRE